LELAYYVEAMLVDGFHDNAEISNIGADLIADTCNPLVNGAQAG
jgi:hypothetical protein